jgi:hypothetical protein
VAETAQWLLSMRELAGEHNPEERRQFTRAATLLQRLASPAYLVVGRPPEGFLDLPKSPPGRIEACTAGVSIEPLGDAAHPTFQDAITLAQGCHDYLGGHSGAEGEAWHGAIDTVVGVLKGATDGPWDSQTMAVFGVGAEAQAGEVAVPVAVSERLRIVRAGIRAGYNLGHHHTVEGSWGDPDEVADDIAQETLDDIGLPPAPQCLIARMANELDRLQPLPAFPPITSHPLAIEAHALLRGGTTTLPAPQAGEVGA